MVDYVESLTDPSYCEQILVLTFPLIGYYGLFAFFSHIFVLTLNWKLFRCTR
jgi:hypothetical protein